MIVFVEGEDGEEGEGRICVAMVRERCITLGMPGWVLAWWLVMGKRANW